MLHCTYLLLFFCRFSSMHRCPLSFFFFFNDTATTEIYTLSLHDALPICRSIDLGVTGLACLLLNLDHEVAAVVMRTAVRSEEHTSELQSHLNIVCRLLLEKKKKKQRYYHLDSSNCIR